MPTNKHGFKTTGTGRAIHRGVREGFEHFPQDGSPIARELWLQPWPRSKKGNEWVRAFGLTYTITVIPPNGFPHYPSYKLTVVGPGGERWDVESTADPEYMKELLWPEGRELPYNKLDDASGELP